MALSEHELAILAFERASASRPGRKERDIRLHLGLTPARYHQALDRLIDRPEALAAEPMTVRRLRRLRVARRSRRIIRSGAGLAEEHVRWG